MKRAFPLIAVALAYFAVTLTWIGSDRRIAQKTFDTFSAANTSHDGLSLAMKYLARSGRRNVKMLTTPPDTALPQQSVVFRVVEGRVAFSIEEFLRRMEREQDEDDEEEGRQAGAPVAPQKGKKKQPHKRVVPLLEAEEEAFIREGGRFVLATGGSYDMLKTRNVEPPQPAVKVFPIWPGIERFSPPIARTLGSHEVLRRSHALYVAGNEPVVARIAIGKGDLILMATPEVFDNEHVVRHLDLLTALTGDRRTIYFDETAHGLLSEGGTLELLRRWRLGPAIVLLLVIAVVTIWRGGRRVGNAEDDYRETRSDAVDLVSSLGALYEDTMTNADAIAMYHHAFTQSVAAQTGLRGEQLQKRVITLTSDMRPPAKGERIDQESFHRMLTTLNESFRRLEHAEHH